MSNDSLTDAAKEAFTLAPSNIPTLDTLEISHPAIASIYLVKDRKNWDLTLEDDGGTKTFRGCGFGIELPTSGENGLQNLNVAIDNVGREVSDFINSVKDSADPVTVIYRPYLTSDPTTPQMDPPLVLELKDVQILDSQVTAKGSSLDVVNKPFLLDIYTRENYPGLGN
jgi:hypothetical protein